MTTPNHLGGHLNVTHVDLGVLDYMIESFGIKSMVDIGCGPGGMEKLAAAKNISWQGIDGDPKMTRESVISHDFSSGPLKIPVFDLGWSVEFVEHVEERYLPNFMETFDSCSSVFITHAPPKKAGHHHVNCQPASYWIAVFEDWGFVFMEEMTRIARSKSTMTRNFARENGLVFKKPSSLLLDKLSQ
jgi:cyclopropane fatty-acyl-phospholipid synthase-like methyltransferase